MPCKCRAPHAALAGTAVSPLILAPLPSRLSLKNPSLDAAAPALSAPKQPALDAAKLNLSAAAALVAAAVAPAMPAACEMVGAADLRLLHCVFGSHFPVCWRL